MEGSRFDQFAKNLVTRADRRRVLQGVSGGVAALLGTMLGREPTEAAPKPPKANCTQSGQTKCRGQCVFLQEDRNNCGACASVCPESRTCCQGSCTNVLTDDNNCGTCGTKCLTEDDQTPRIDAAEICVNGQCVECSVRRLEEGLTRCCRGLIPCGDEQTGITCRTACS